METKALENKNSVQEETELKYCEICGDFLLDKRTYTQYELNGEMCYVCVYCMEQFD